MQWNTLGGKKRNEKPTKQNHKQTNQKKNKTKIIIIKKIKRNWGRQDQASRNLRFRLLLTKPRVVTVIELSEAGDCCWTLCFYVLKNVAPGALPMVSCQLLAFKNVHSHSSEAIIPFRASEQQYIHVTRPWAQHSLTRTANFLLSGT